MAEANDTWIDQLNNTVLFYQQSCPNVDWQQYLGRVAAIRDGLATETRRPCRRHRES